MKEIKMIFNPQTLTPSPTSGEGGKVGDELGRRFMETLNEAQFQKYGSFIYENLGIYIGPEKKEMLQSKLLKLLIRYSTTSYEEYYTILTRSSDPNIFVDFANEITINKTDFFRENNHFEFIKKKQDFILEKNKRIKRSNEIRVWSSACSTGEEPYTIGMILQEHFLPGVNVKILGTDISARALSVGMRGVYPPSIKSNVDKYYLLKYFKKSGQDFKVNEGLKRLVTLRMFNLMDEFPFKKLFDIIFCRNVMIYFDNKVQEKLVNKFYDVLAPGGLLFIGHSETLTNKKQKYNYIQPTVYMK